MPTLSGSPRGSRRRQRNTELIALRINAGLSREMLGYKAGVGRETIRMAEEGQWVPTPRVQYSIAKALETTPLELWPIELQVAR